MKPQKTPDGQSKLEQKEQYWRDYHPRLEDVLKTHNNKYNLVQTGIKTDM